MAILRTSKPWTGVTVGLIALLAPVERLADEAAGQQIPAGPHRSVLPAPTGGFHVGTLRFWWTDATRAEGAKPDDGDHRELHVQLFYPRARPMGTATPSVYFRDLSAFDGVFEKDVIQGLEQTVVQATVGGHVAPDRERYPVLLFVHGWQAQSDAYTALLTELASHGFIVAAIDQPYQGRVALRDGSVSAASESHFSDPMAMVSYYGADQSFVLTRLEELDSGTGPLSGRIDTSRVLAMGHSNGALSALGAALRDPRLRAVVSIDGWDPAFEQVFRLDPPLMLLRTGGAVPVGAEYLEQSSNVTEVSLVDTEHLSASDWPLHRASSDGERTAAAVNVGLIAEAIRHFAAWSFGSDAGLSAGHFTDPDRVSIRRGASP